LRREDISVCACAAQLKSAHKKRAVPILGIYRFLKAPLAAP
jgi:hypothetical protein